MIGRMEIPTINPVVTISTQRNIIIKTNLTLVVWKGRAEANSERST
jgi:hypothetical protein